MDRFLATEQYDRICDVPKDRHIVCPWMVRAISYKHPGVKTFEFELSYGAHPRYWPGWNDKPDWTYLQILKRPEDFDRHFRVL